MLQPYKIAMLSLIMIYCTVSYSQNSENEESLYTASLDFIDEYKKLNERSTKVYKAFELDASVFGLSVSKDFGSYLIPNTNFLKLVSNSDIIYTRAELVNKETGDIIFKIILDKKKNTVDMTGTQSGVYKLILSNRQNNRYTEDIAIM